MSTLCAMDDPTPADLAEATLPGEALQSGFTFRPARNVPEARLSSEAHARVLETMESVDRARLRAAKDASTAYVG